MNKRIFILGASSAIAQAFARKMAVPEAVFVLVGRNRTRLQNVADDLLARGAGNVEVQSFDPGDFGALKSIVEAAFRSTGGIDLFLSTQGVLPSQEACEADPGLLTEVFRANATEVMQGALLAANEFERQGHGSCVIIGSVAGDRGRKGNYVYGAAKASLEVFCDGLRQRLEPAVHVLLVKPGPVDTPMTAHLAKGPLFCSPDKVAEDIQSALAKRSSVLYTPFYWRWIMMIIKQLPSRLVKRLRA